VFVLGGGASLGAHQVGALRYLDEQGIRPDAIVASSIGVINACLYASGGVDHMEEAWTGMGSVAGKFRPSWKHNPISGFSLFSMDPLAETIERYIDFDRVLNSPIDLSFVLLNLSRGEGQFASNRHMTSVREARTLTRAGYAIPMLFPPVRHKGEYFVDGGFAWNVPVLQAIEMGATEVYVLAVIASALPYKRSFRTPLDYYGRLADVMWRTIGNVGYVTTGIDRDGSYHGVPVTVLQPTEQHAGFSPLSLFSWSAARTRRLIVAGYSDAKREILRRRRRRTAGAALVAEGETSAVTPAFRHEVA
jgi:predicted acylesterase/phospholipase RssA